MVIVALLLIALVVVFAVVVLTGPNPAITLDLRAFKVDMSLTGVYVSGVATVVIAVIGLWLLRSGLRRSRNRRSEVKQLRHRVRTSERAATDSTSRGPVAEPPDEPNDHFDSAPRDSS